MTTAPAAYFAGSAIASARSSRSARCAGHAAWALRAAVYAPPLLMLRSPGLGGHRVLGDAERLVGRGARVVGRIDVGSDAGTLAVAAAG